MISYFYCRLVMFLSSFSCVRKLVQVFILLFFNDYEGWVSRGSRNHNKLAQGHKISKCDNNNLVFSKLFSAIHLDSPTVESLLRLLKRLSSSKKECKNHFNPLMYSLMSPFLIPFEYQWLSMHFHFLLFSLIFFEV